MSSTNLSQEDSLIDLKRELDHLSFDRNNPSTFVSGQPDVRERALTLVNSYLEIFSNCSIGLLYKSHLKANTSSGKEKGSGPRSQPSITSLFSKRQKTDHDTGSNSGEVQTVQLPEASAENEAVVSTTSIPSTVFSINNGLERDPGLRELIHIKISVKRHLLTSMSSLGRSSLAY